MEDWQQRVVTEQSELQTKLTDLITFIEGPNFKALDAVQQDLLVQQASYMSHYNDILKTRIGAF
jgi:hypothetical protein